MSFSQILGSTAKGKVTNQEKPLEQKNIEHYNNEFMPNFEKEYNN